MFERFTEKSIKVIMLAQEEARYLGHNFIGTEQILLGLLGEETGIAGTVLKSRGINLRTARQEVEKVVGRGANLVTVEIPFTYRAKQVLELALEEARHRGHNHIGTEHLLLGLLRIKDGGAIILKNMGVELQSLREQLIRKMNELTNGAAEGMENTTGIALIQETGGTTLPKLASKIDQLIIQLTNALREATEIRHQVQLQIQANDVSSSNVTGILEQLPDTSEPSRPEIKELLTQLQAAIEIDSELSPEDKAEAFEQLIVLAELGQDLADKKKQKFARTALKILKGTITELSPTNQLIETADQLLPEISKAFSLA